MKRLDIVVTADSVNVSAQGYHAQINVSLEGLDPEDVIDALEISDIFDYLDDKGKEEAIKDLE